MKKETYQNRKNAGLCVKCGKDVHIENSVLCVECSIKQSEYQENARNKEEYKNRVNNWFKKKRIEREKNGCCTKCGKKLNDKRYKQCLECRLYQRRYMYYKRAQTNKLYSVNGTCLNCGGVRVPGKFYCDDCLEKKQSSMEYARNMR